MFAVCQQKIGGFGVLLEFAVCQAPPKDAGVSRIDRFTPRIDWPSDEYGSRRSTPGPRVLMPPVSNCMGLAAPAESAPRRSPTSGESISA